MINIGIDIAKLNHYASVVDSNGVVLHEAFLFQNNKQGFELLLSKIDNFSKDDLLFGLESTAHYGENLISYLFNKGFKIGIINPIQTSALRKSNVRKTKNDKVDTYLIVKALSLNMYTLLRQRDIDIIKLKSLCRYLQTVTKMRSKCKIQLCSYVDQLFPELNSFFKNNLHINTSYQLLKLHSSPSDISKLHLTTLTNLFIKSSRGKYSKCKAEELKQLASNSVGVDNYSLSLQIKLAVEQIEFYSNQIKIIENEIVSIMDLSDNLLTTIKGVGHITSARIISEIGDITRFSNPNKILAFAGLDPAVKQSGQFNAHSCRMSKRGSSSLRDALMKASFNLVKNNKTFKEYYNKKRAQGKLHYNALGHCCNKLIRVIYKMLIDNVPFNLE